MTTDPPYYTTLDDGRAIHLCAMPGHSRYWLNVGARLWICEACHPGVGPVVIEEVGAIVEGVG